MKIADKKGAVKAALIALTAVLIIGAFVGGYFAGKSGQRIETQYVQSDSEVIYAEILRADDGFFHVKGLEVNDINGRGEYTFSVKDSTRLVWRGTPLSVTDFEAGDTVAVFYSGEVMETFPAQIGNVTRIKLLDDEV